MIDDNVYLFKIKQNYVKLKLNGAVTVFTSTVNIEELSKSYDVEPCTS
jgi:hypothetical protein